MTNKTPDNTDNQRPTCPGGGPDDASPMVFVKLGGRRRLADDPALDDAAHAALRKAIDRVLPDDVSGQALVKVHIGEPKCRTRMRPPVIRSTVGALRDRGVTRIAAGDTTVAYTGDRGHRQNPSGNASTYLALAQKHGWSVDGEADVPFVVLDRPSTSVPDAFAFDDEEHRAAVDGIIRFKDFYRAGGFDAADVVVNHAHLTLHGLAGLAGCMKSVAMGCTSLKGKLRMHQSLLPEFDVELCASCGRCVSACPEEAIELVGDPPMPRVDAERCIGCGECEAICATGRRAVRLKGREITDWVRGSDTLPVRMADYTLGLMAESWDKTIHVLQLTTITERCDCIDVAQTPMIDRDLGFLVGRNPFALDRIAGDLLTEALTEDGVTIDDHVIDSAAASADYVERAYGVTTASPVNIVEVT